MRTWLSRKYLAMSLPPVKPAARIVSTNEIETRHADFTNLQKPKATVSRWSPMGIAATLLCAVAGLACGPSALAGDRDRDGRWVSVWQGSPALGGTFDSPSCPSDVGLSNRTVRNLVFISAGGHSVRARISNAYGSDPLQVGAASIAISAGGAATVPGSLHRLLSAGKARSW